MSEHHTQSFWSKYIFPLDHKMIGMQYLFTGMFMAVLGGLMAYVFRMQLAFPGESVPGFGIVSPANYNALVTNHGTIMVFWVAMPILLAALGNFLIPLMIGCDDMVFPRLNRLSYQIFLLSALVLIASWFVPGGGFGGAWTSYPPLSARADFNHTDWGASLWLIAIALEIVAFLLGGINFLTTTMNSRAPGMTAFRMPIIIWMLNISTVVFMASVGPLVAGAVMLLMDQRLGTSFFVPDKGGDPVLWQHLFWFFGHPEVYVVLFPPLGICAEVFTTFARKKIFGYKLIVYTAIATGGLSFIVWAHHQFIAGIDPRMGTVFAITTVLISVPIAEMLFAYIATLYGGSIEFKTPMYWALGFLFTFILGGVTGIHLGANASDIYLHDTYFVVAHFHYTFFPIAIIGSFAALYYWFPKMFGKTLDETLGKIHCIGTIGAFNLVFIPLFFLGMAGQHRRIWGYTTENFPELAQYQHLRVFATVSLIVMLIFQIPFFINLFITFRKKEKNADANPWQANSLEWLAPSPPPHGNFPDGMPEVYRGPYEYSLPNRQPRLLASTYKTVN